MMISDTPRRAFTLIESVMSMVLVSILLIVGLNSVGAAGQLQSSDVIQRQGLRLATDLMDEIAALSYEDPDGSAVFGREAGEAAGSRSDWDDIDDYVGWESMPPIDKSDGVVADSVGWKRSVAVTYVDPVTLLDAGSDTNLKKIIVTATSPAGVQVSLTLLRSRYPTAAK